MELLAFVSAELMSVQWKSYESTELTSVHQLTYIFGEEGIRAWKTCLFLNHTFNM